MAVRRRPYFTNTPGLDAQNDLGVAKGPAMPTPPRRPMPGQVSTEPGPGQGPMAPPSALPELGGAPPAPDPMMGGPGNSGGLPQGPVTGGPAGPPQLGQGDPQLLVQLLQQLKQI